ncbi:hypothetical protein CNYM01_04016 [Colletotrichum nymphaeae SA-01]|uniref:Uncharacterized protein n=1 Tax=Colletotrichum nymphaeae SA-01 TaxID=1460502 RepID=A0A135TC93_9PEZI|nr:hypothetical protein CNYM01_04016 [Colletotrichum nymphaeae SA-01]
MNSLPVAIKAVVGESQREPPPSTSEDTAALLEDCRKVIEEIFERTEAYPEDSYTYAPMWLVLRARKTQYEDKCNTLEKARLDDMRKIADCGNAVRDILTEAANNREKVEHEDVPGHYSEIYQSLKNIELNLGEGSPMSLADRGITFKDDSSMNLALFGP